MTTECRVSFGTLNEPNGKNDLDDVSVLSHLGRREFFVY